MLSFVHNVLIEDVQINPSGNGAKCNSSYETTKTVMLLCTNLSYASNYSLNIRGMASLNKSESNYLEFSVSLDFSTALDEQG